MNKIYNFTIFKGTGGQGGVQPQKMRFLCFNICCSPCSGASKISLNSKQLLRYDATKFALPHAFSQICMGKMVKSDPDFNLRRVFPIAW